METQTTDQQPTTPEAAEDQVPADAQTTEPPGPAIFQSDAPFSHVDDSWPACLSTPTSGFWDNPTFI